MEHSEVQFGSTPIAYTIHRGRRVKTVGIAVDPVDGVLVRAPEGTDVERLDEIVHRKAKWILERRRHQEDLPPPPSPREFVSGETFLYLGRQYRLKVDRRLQGDRVRLVWRHLLVPGRDGGDPRDMLTSWYRERAEARLPGCVALWADRLDAQPASVLIREQRKRWGSADAKGNIRLNWRIVQAPKRLIDYVVAHEVEHLHYPDHTSDFWSTLGAVLPDYEQRREALRRLGPQLIW